MPWPRGRQAANAGTFWSDEVLAKAFEYVKDGWSVDYALSRAGVSTTAIVRKPFKQNKIYRSMVEFASERDRNNKRPRSFITCGSQTQTGLPEARSEDPPIHDNSLPCGVFQTGSTLDAGADSRTETVEGV